MFFINVTTWLLDMLPGQVSSHFQHRVSSLT